MNADNPALYTQSNIIIVTLPFAAFFIGVLIRKFALQSEGSPALLKLLLLSIPVALVVVSPFLLIMPVSIVPGQMSSTLLTLGIIMEHGMIVPETIAHHLERLRKESPKAATPTQSA